MKKGSVILIIILTAGLLISWAFFFKGKLVIKVDPAPATIIVDNKEYKDRKELSLNIRAKNHDIKIMKDGYKDYSEKVKVNFGKIKNIEVTLELTNEAKQKQELERIARDITDLWINYTDEKSDIFLEQIKPKVSPDVYESLKLEIQLSKKSSREDITYEIAKVTGPIKDTQFLSFQNDSATIRINTTKNTELDSVSSLDFDYQMVENQWKVINIKYNY